MYSESESVRQTFAYPQGENPSVHAQSSRKSFSRRPRNHKNPIKDQFFFKIKVLKHVGQLISNLKSSISLESHGLTESQLSYLEGSENQGQPECLLRQDNWLVLFAQAFLWLLMWIELWKCSFELVFQRLEVGLFLDIIFFITYVCYLCVFFNSNLRNQRQELIMVRSVIAKNYLFYRFPKILPFLLSIAIDSIISPAQSSFIYYLIRFIPLTLLPQISILYKSLENVISAESRGQIVLMFAKLLGKVILFLHFISLLLNAARNLEIKLGYQQNWVEKYRSSEIFNSGELYLLGWYWASTILCTVGFGDIVPVNNIQRGLISFLQVFSALIFGYFVNYIGSLIKMQAEKTDLFQINLRRLNRYLSKVNIPGTLKKQARAHFFDHQQIIKTQNQQQEQQVLGSLNQKIRTNIIQKTNLDVLKFTSLAQLINPDLVKNLALKMHKLIYAPQQTIYCPESSFSQKLWILQKGKIIDRWYDRTGKYSKDVAVYTHQPHQNILGWINFLKQAAYNLTAKCENFCILHEISRKDFFEIIKQNRQDFLKVMQTRDQLILTNKAHVSRCLCCQRLTHNTIDCPKIHFPKCGSYFLFTKQKRQNLFCQIRKRNKKLRNQRRYNWKQYFDRKIQDPNISQQQEVHIQSSANFTLSPRNFSNKYFQQEIKRPSVDQIVEFVKKCSMKLIQKEERLATNKRLSSKIDISSEYASHKNIDLTTYQKNILNLFDKRLQDQIGYFKDSNYLVVIQKYSESKTLHRKIKV